jgi:hypothetical protein
VAQALDEAKRQRDLTKESLERNLGLFETRVRHELDWKARLRRDGARYAVYGAVAVAGLAGVYMLRRTVARGDDHEERPVARPGDLAGEIAELRKVLKGMEKDRGKGDGPMWTKLAVRVVSAAAAAGASSAMKRYMHSAQEEPERSSSR